MPDHTFGGYPKKRTNPISERAHLGGSRNNLHWVSETYKARLKCLLHGRTIFFLHRARTSSFMSVRYKVPFRPLQLDVAACWSCNDATTMPRKPTPEPNSRTRRVPTNSSVYEWGTFWFTKNVYTDLSFLKGNELELNWLPMFVIQWYHSRLVSLIPKESLFCTLRNPQH